MTRALAFTTRFNRDLKRVRKRGKDPEKFKTLINLLVADVPLPSHYRDHALVGNYVGRRECHLEPDWLLIYKLTETEIILERPGSHADLFE